MQCLREAGQVLYDVWTNAFVTFQYLIANIYLQKYQSSFAECIEAAACSAAALVNILAADFPCFNDVVQYENRKSVRLLKRAQICVADLWAAFDGQSFGEFHDIDKISMFADYRVPQILNSLGCLWYSPALETAIRKKQLIESGHRWEIQLRGSFEGAILDEHLSTDWHLPRLQYLVRRTDPQRDSTESSRC